MQTFKNQLSFLTQVTSIQSDNSKWYLNRAGRLTASISKQAMTTDINNPSKTFISTVMQYKEHKKFPATEYGSKSEAEARNCYLVLMKE